MKVMKALALVEAGRMEPREVATPAPRPHEILVEIGAVGLCGTDFHIFEGHANYHTDARGRPIPLREQPQILGHEMCGRVAALGAEVRDLRVGDRVVLDQGLNCRSRGEAELCEYCATGNTHQCARYAEHGITGVQGGLAEYVAIPAVNAVRVEAELRPEEMALVEPLGCVIHASEMAAAVPARYRFGGERPIRSTLVCGAGPAGLLFIQYLRQVVGYDGLLVVAEPNAKRRQLAADYGATAVDPTVVDLVEAVQDLTGGEKLHYLIDAAAAARLFSQMPGLLRKQATVLLYGHGHHGADLSVLSSVQFLEPTLVAPVGASGALDPDGRPRTYRRALELLSAGRIDVSRFITHRYARLEDVPQAFGRDRFGDDYIKGVAVFGRSSPANGTT